MSTEPAFVTIKEAAALSGCSRMTVVRAVQRGEIEQLEQPGQEGKKVTIYLRKTSVLAWKSTRPITPDQLEEAELAQDAHEDQVGQQEHAQVNQPAQNTGQAEQALHAMNLLADALERQTDQAARERERANRAERLLAARDHELQSFRRALGEQAESLLKERARFAHQQARAEAEEARAHAAQLSLVQVNQIAQDAQRSLDQVNQVAQAAQERLNQVAQDAQSAQNELAQVVQERDQLAQDAQAVREELEQLKLCLPTPKIGWGIRWKKWLGLKTG